MIFIKFGNFSVIFFSRCFSVSFLVLIQELLCVLDVCVSSPCLSVLTFGWDPFCAVNFTSLSFHSIQCATGAFSIPDAVVLVSRTSGHVFCSCNYLPPVLLLDIQHRKLSHSNILLTLPVTCFMTLFLGRWRSVCSPHIVPFAWFLVTAMRKDSWVLDIAT